MQKGASNADLKKRATPDDDFGKDFFNSWKSTKLGNDSVDFDVEAVPKNKKASFKFDELDNFELSGNFDKLPSFKLDVPDLDFSSPSKKKEKTTEKSSKELVKGKKEPKDDKFSFDFDFNSFDLDSKSQEDKRPINFSDKNVPELPSKHEMNQVSDQRSDFAHKTEVSFGIRADIPKNNEKKTCVTMAGREHSEENYLTKENSDNSKYFSLQSFSGDGSTEVVLPEIQMDSAPSDVVKPREIMSKHDSIHPISSSPSMSSSPVDSYNSGCWTKASENELPNPGTLLQNQNKGLSARITGSLTGSIKIRKDANNSSGLNKSTEGVKNIDEKQNSCQNLIVPPEKNSSRKNLMLPPLKSEIKFGGSTKLHGLMSTGLQLKSIGNLEDNIPQKISAFISKPFNSTLDARAKTTHASITKENSLQIKTSSASHQNSLGSKNVATPRLQKPITDTTIDPKGSYAGNNTGSVKENVIAKLISSNRLGSQITKTNKGATSGDNSHRGIIGSAISKMIDVNQNKPNSAKPREAKSVPFLEKRMECPLNAASKTTNSANIEMKASLHASLKRKIDEQSAANLETASPLECVEGSNANLRISLEASPNAKVKMFPEIKVVETCKDLIPLTNQTSLTSVPEMENLVAGVSPFFMEDDNLRKAETLTKELENICNLVRKKHEEAKELQVRSIINNNALLLLNYPMLEEKIQSLQKFSSSLLLKQI
ncbi:uncharacterized protein At4g18490 isoform X1 [Dendrobium catenatum]|uniref:Uncharacterized protein n=1 Tax=Dendrobium catenatum TaxID=906689 RepID=A0A2I0VIM3_9ASPA|nr:uncharacterized protein At4g18490 isoform X1 [Dendrobium catenatum]XP_020687382.1 uncharacterized protein At4g18490 isoform X1 [Dendrobium catenatum]PKU63266.1 Uncharacterized protein MA16_Dca014732 [Dendrobium catenatum]